MSMQDAFLCNHSPYSMFIYFYSKVTQTMNKRRSTMSAKLFISLWTSITVTAVRYRDSQLASITAKAVRYRKNAQLASITATAVRYRIKTQQKSCTFFFIFTFKENIQGGISPFTSITAIAVSLLTILQRPLVFHDKCPSKY